MVLVVELDGADGQLFKVTFPYRDETESVTGRLKQGFHVTPKIVAVCIQHALSDGWAPDKPGSVFYHYDYEKEVVKHH
jgi:hypothetical protein